MVAFMLSAQFLGGCGRVPITAAQANRPQVMESVSHSCANNKSYPTSPSNQGTGHRSRIAEQHSVADSVHLTVARSIAPSDATPLAYNIFPFANRPLQERRAQQETEAFAAEYARRAGIEGTISQGVRAFGLRRAKYIGAAKTHLQHILTAAAIDFVRVAEWLDDAPLAKTRRSAFVTLMQPQPAAA